MSTSPEVLAYVPGTVPAPRASGFVEGYAGGYAEGLRIATSRAAADAAREAAEGRRRAQAHEERLRAALDTLATTTQAVRAERLLDAGRLADLVATCVADLVREVVLAAAPSPLALRARLERALAQVDAGQQVVVRISPGQVHQLGAEDTAAHPGALVLADPSLADGDVVVTAGATQVTDLVSEAVARVVAELRGTAGDQA